MCQGGETGAYRPPKIAPASLDADVLRAGGAGGVPGAKLPGAKGGKRGGESRSAFLKELAAELEGRPEEVGFKCMHMLCVQSTATQTHTRLYIHMDCTSLKELAAELKGRPEEVGLTRVL